jgi:hypothetical protein
MRRFLRKGPGRRLVIEDLGALKKWKSTIQADDDAKTK